MPAKTGQEYISRLQQQPCEVWIRGERVKDVTTHPAFCRGVASVRPSGAQPLHRQSGIYRRHKVRAFLAQDG
jgi:hypothetical protein